MNQKKPIDLLDRATSTVDTDQLVDRGVQQLRILSESRFLDLVHSMVHDTLREHLNAEAEADAAAPQRATGDVTPHDQKLEREYQRRWDLLRSQHDRSVRQTERRIERLSQVMRKLERALKRQQVRAATRAATGTDAEKPSRDQKSLLREMLLSENDDAGA